MSVLFANNEGSGPKIIYKFRAGRTKQIPVKEKPNTFRVVPQLDPGTVYVERGEDNLLHICWKNHTTNRKELDIIILTHLVKFVPVKECKDGRVYMLKFKNNYVAHCFWLQDANKKKDDEILVKVTEALKNIQPAGSTQLSQILKRRTP